MALVAGLALAFAVGTGQHFTTFGLYVVGAVFVSVLITVFRGSYEMVTASLLRAAGVRRKVVLVGDDEARAHLRASLGASRGGIIYDFVGEVEQGSDVEDALDEFSLDELIVADTGLDDARLLEIVDHAHRRGVRVRVAPRTADLLIERGEYVPGQGIPLFELRPPTFAGAQWATKRVFDLVVGGLIAIVGLPIWLLVAIAIKLTSRGPMLYADPRIGLGEQRFLMQKFRTMRAGAADDQEALELQNEASGALFKIRDDPRVTGVGRFLRKYSLDEVPNVINVLRGRDVARRAAPVAGARLRTAGGVAPAALQRPAGHDRAVAGRGSLRPHLRRPRAARLLLHRELVDLARHVDPAQDAVRGLQAQGRLLEEGRSGS